MPEKAPETNRSSLLKRYLPRTLLWRSFLIILLPLLLLQIGATWFFYDRHYSLVTRRLAQWSAGSIALIADTLERQPDSATTENLEPLARRVLLMTLTFEPGSHLPEGEATAPDGYLERYLSRAMNATVQRPYIMDSDSLEEFVKLDIQLSTGVLTVLVRKEHLFTDTSYIFIIWMVGSSMVLFAVAMIFMRNQVRSIRRLARAADSFGRGLDVTGFKPEGAAEVRQAAQAFLQMRQRIKRQIQQRTEMLAGVSHDLRTPLTRMKLELALMPKSAEAEALAADLAEMEHMIEGYLAFARGEGSEPPSQQDLAQLLADVVEQTKRGGRDIKLSGLGEKRMILRPAAMRRCLTNLLENAARYGKTIEVRLREETAWVEILIDDDGPGIPAAHREAVFKPFFRLDQARSPDRGGSGLGLTIARDVARGHGGEIVLEDSPLGGLRVRLRLPA